MHFEAYITIERDSIGNTNRFLQFSDICGWHGFTIRNVSVTATSEDRLFALLSRRMYMLMQDLQRESFRVSHYKLTHIILDEEPNHDDSPRVIDLSTTPCEINIA